MAEVVAHDLECETRTADIEIKSKIPFSRMPLKADILRGLKNAGFEYPTVLQASAITLGNMGLDLLVQAKSGTGKTLVFCTILLNAYQAKVRKAQALVVTPTREIAVQIEEILNKLGGKSEGFKAVCAIGGIDVMDNRKCLQNAKAVVGTPGRLVHLIKSGMLNLTHSTLLVLDEVDKLLMDSFRHEIRQILAALPKKHQTICCSATIEGAQPQMSMLHMQNPLLISAEGQTSVLVGIKQFVYALPRQESSALEIRAKLKAVNDILCHVAFKQCLVFAGSQARAETYATQLQREGWSCALISGAQDQPTRLEIFKLFQSGSINILIATDLMSRGVDLCDLNLVINLDVPQTLATYLHRIGRAGRFGTHGIAINILASEANYAGFGQLMVQASNIMQVMRYPAPRAAVSMVEERNIWDFSDLQEDLRYYGQFEGEVTDSELDTKTFDVELPVAAPLAVVPDISKGHEADVEDIEDAEDEEIVHLPSFSNTIDDASSLMVDNSHSELTEDSNDKQFEEDVKRLKELLFGKSLSHDSTDTNGSVPQLAAIKNKDKFLQCCADYKLLKTSNKCN